MHKPADPLVRIAEALERISPPPIQPDLSSTARFIWQPRQRTLVPIPDWHSPDLGLLCGLEDQAARLLAAVNAFASGARANHALLWGARGTGKSALAKAVFAAGIDNAPHLKVIELPAAAIADATDLIDAIATANARAIVFIDDLSLEAGELALRALKPALDGTMSASNGAVMVVATANRRHIMAQTPDRTEQGFDPARADAEHERLALSDRFGLWLGFHPIDQATYLAIVNAYAARFALAPSGEPLQRAALQWAAARGARSGRTAWQFILDLASTQGKAITF